MDEQAKLKSQTPSQSPFGSGSDMSARLRLHDELFEAEDNLARMEEARRQCIEVWNRDIRAAKKIIAAKRNALRSGALQPELRDMIKGKAKS